jgi:hypothetical protein
MNRQHQQSARDTVDEEAAAVDDAHGSCQQPVVADDTVPAVKWGLSWTALAEEEGTADGRVGAAQPRTAAAQAGAGVV